MLGFGIQNSVQVIARESHKRLEMESKFQRQGIRSSVPGIRRHCAEDLFRACTLIACHISDRELCVQNRI